MNVPSLASVAHLASTQFESPAVAPLTREERARASHLKGAALRSASPAEQRAAVASQFEAILVRQMLGKTVESMLGKQDSAATSVYGDLLTDTFAKQITAGGGMGLAPMIERQLTPRGATSVAPANKPNSRS